MNRRFVPPFVLLISAACYYLIYRTIGYTCPSVILIGWPCPGCGLTRAALLLLQGDIPGSLRMNPMLLFIPAYFILLFCKKKKAADIFLITAIITSFIVFGWRIINSFGTEPLIYNPDNVLCFIYRMLKKIYLLIEIPS